MAKGFKRVQRINDLIQTTLAEIIQREAKDLRFGLVTLTGVNVSHDLAYAKVFVSVLEEDKAQEQPKPMAENVGAPAVPIAIQMGQVGDRTTSIAPLPIFSCWPGVDPDQHIAQFLTACIANNRRTEDIWMRWFLATLKDVAFEWYNRQPVGGFANWDLLKQAFLTDFQSTGFKERL